jgi:hypothetical protein
MRLALLAILSACGGGGGSSGDAGPDRACMVATTPSCMDATTHSDLAWIEANVFLPQCAFSGCHNGSATVAGRLNLKDPGQSHDDLVNFASAIATDRKLVVAGAPKQSYLMMMLRAYPPGEMDPPVAPPPTSTGFMPMNAGGAVVCCQKLDAIERWITAGAPN